VLRARDEAGIDQHQPALMLDEEDRDRDCHHAGLADDQDMAPICQAQAI
jgi:hypothetical protein